MSEEAEAAESGAYAAKNLRKEEVQVDVGLSKSAFNYSFGNDYSRRGNIFLIEDHRLMYVSGNTIVFEDLRSKKKEYLLGIDEGGIGCIQVHPTRTIFAVGGKGCNPNIYIYEYPSKKILKILRNGAERGYSSMSFNITGNKLASVAMAPDYMLTVWNWETESVDLHSKAFGQDVFTVRFSLDDDKRLTTSGTGHIRFWKMAQTFTGLKLQGSIGKFGKVELSDISSFVELPDGKVLSGTETGSLLLWEGNFIKCRFVIKNGACHAGEVTYVEYDRKEGCIITAGMDGCIKLWDYTIIDSAEVDSDNTMDFELVPIAEYQVTSENSTVTSIHDMNTDPLSDAKIGIKTFIDSGIIEEENQRFFVIVDSNSRTRVIYLSLMDDNGSAATKKLSHVFLSIKNSKESCEALVYPPRIETLNYGHAGVITGLDTSPFTHIAATSGVDGTVRYWDYSSKTLLAVKQYSTAVTSLRWYPGTDRKDSSVVAGFSDGLIRILSLRDNTVDVTVSRTIERKMASKPHNAEVVSISFNSNSTLVATCGKDGLVFFYDCSKSNNSGAKRYQWTPLRFIKVSPDNNAVYPVNVAWNPYDDNSSIVVTCSDGIVRHYDITELLKLDTNSEVSTYEIELPFTEYCPRVAVANEFAAPPAGSPTSSPSKPTATSVTYRDMKCVSVCFNTAESDRPKNTLLFGLKDDVIGRIVECAVKDVTNLPATTESDFFLGNYSVDGKGQLPVPTVTCMGFSKSKAFLTQGCSDGSIIVRPVSGLESFARIVGHNGDLTHCTTSFDDNYVLSTGKDGILGVHRISSAAIISDGTILSKNYQAGVYSNGNHVKSKASSIPNEPEFLSYVYEDEVRNVLTKFPTLPSVGPLEVRQTEGEADDVSSSSYSIQDAKLKSEEDAHRASAEDQKKRVRQSIMQLQKLYRGLIHENEQLPPDVRLTADQLQIDKELFESMAADSAGHLSEVHTKSAYNLERAILLRQQVTNALTSRLVVDEIGRAHV
jgi:WD40 repeat protein